MDPTAEGVLRHLGQTTALDILRERVARAEQPIRVPRWRSWVVLMALSVLSIVALALTGLP